MNVAPPLDPSTAKLTSPFGWRTLRGEPDLHTGIDLAAAEGTPVYATAAGRVRLVDWVSGYGQTLVLEHEGPTFTLYGHLVPGSVRVVRGQPVAAGELVAAVGRSAGTREQPSEVSRPHLHFEMLTAWPPRDRDLDRVDPTSAVWSPFVGMRGRPTPAAAAGGTFLLLLGALWWSRQRKKMGRRRSDATTAPKPVVTHRHART